MTVEHRWDARLPVEVQVALIHPTLGTLRGYVANVSDGGACLATGTLRLPPNAILEMTFTLTAGQHAHVVRLPVLVVWSITGVAGVMFCQLDETGSNARNTLLSCARASLNAPPPAHVFADNSGT